MIERADWRPLRTTCRGRIQRLAGLLGAAAVLGCSTATEPTAWSLNVGSLMDSPDLSAALSLPATARVGQPVAIIVTTGGSGTCTRPGGATVRIAGLMANVVPLDETPVAGSSVACTRDLRAYPRTVRLTFEAPGEARVVVTGFRLGWPGGLVSVEGTLTVEP